MDEKIEALAHEVRQMRLALDGLVAALMPDDTGDEDPVGGLAEALMQLAQAVKAQADAISVVSNDVRAVRLILADLPLPQRFDVRSAA